MAVACATSVARTEVLQEDKIMFIVQILLRANNIRMFYFLTGSLKIDSAHMSKNIGPSIFTNMTNPP